MIRQIRNGQFIRSPTLDQAKAMAARIEAKYGFPQSPATIESTTVPLMILADPAYPLLPWLIKPFTGTSLPPAQESFNHSSVRIMVEHAFGRLKARWRILGKRVDARIDNAPDIIATCCALHNMCERTNGPLMEDLPLPCQDEPIMHDMFGNTVADANAVAIRHAIVRHFVATRPMRRSSR